MRSAERWRDRKGEFKMNEDVWEYWMFRCCSDPNTGEKYGWSRVLDYIGVGYL